MVCGCRNYSSCSYLTHRDSVALGTFCIFLLILFECVSFDGSAVRAFPYIVIDSVKLLLEILRVRQQFIILLFFEAIHAGAACGAFQFPGAV